MEDFNVFPIITEARQIEALQRKFPNVPVCQNRMVHAKTVNDFAAGFLALWLYSGTYPAGKGVSRLYVDGRGRAEVCMQALRGGVRREIVRGGGTEFGLMSGGRTKWDTYEEVMRLKTVVTPAFRTKGGGVAMIEAAPSDMARREAAELRDRVGGGYQGARSVRKKETCRRFDQKDLASVFP